MRSPYLLQAVEQLLTEMIREGLHYFLPPEQLKGEARRVADALGMLSLSRG